ncbi:primosomal protein N' [Pirellulaceae bacterium]|jgi:primosomal protein N' (replication factor Y)|nr:primosomal protein N' [Pirellulaceae bacterium]MDB4413261.1 primosomal protein N' [Pirellulaceae bacterium]
MTEQKNLFNVDPEPWLLDDMDDFQTASIVFAEAPYGPYEYIIPSDWSSRVAKGMRVRVPLGRGSRKVMGYCIEINAGQQKSRSFDRSKLRDIAAIVDEAPLVNDSLLELAKWISEQYLCPLGTVIETIVPAGVRTKAGTREIAFLSVPNQVVAKLTQLQLPKKQAEALKILSASSSPLTVDQLADAAGCSAAPIKSLCEKKLIHVDLERVHQNDHDLKPRRIEADLELNPAQQSALDQISQVVRDQASETIVLHGITGSGKTEVYIRAIQEVIEHGRQAIVLVPEISLTPQTRQRFRARFKRVAVMHSHLTPSERHWHWQQIANGQIEVVVGARSAVFAPLPRLGIIVIDEEHDGSFKQDKAPRYHARDVARKRSELARIPLVLGSATPSLESYHLAKAGDYKLIRLPHRALNRPLPDVSTIDLRTEFASKSHRGAISRPLQNAMKEALSQDGQVILLLNRRGFATSIQCPSCGYVVECPNCDIALTHHQDSNRAVCHYCDYMIPSPVRCSQCDYEGIRFSGLGTQKLEAEVKSRFPNDACLRMDSDTMQRIGSHEEALDRFRNGEIKILLGTQMIAKGLDFPNVTLVGVINADTALHLPDFRAAERTFCLVTQVAGRTGRGDKGGRVLVQTFNPENPTIQAAEQHDFERFAEQEIPEREQFGYPPFRQLARIVVRGESEVFAGAFATQIGEELRKRIKVSGDDIRVLGPAAAPINKLRGKYRFHLFASGADGELLRRMISEVTGQLRTPNEIQWIVDIDPLDML